MELDAVKQSYARWARVYDTTFGVLTRGARRAAVDRLNAHGGHVLEVGAGTGLALPLYAPGVTVTAIDFSEDMLAKARQKVAARDLDHVVSLRQMDARRLDVPDASFDAVAAMHVLSVVPEPERVMTEIARVLKPGGTVVISNHFARTDGPMAAIERRLEPFADRIGWHADFDKDRILREPSLSVLEERRLPPLGLMTLLVLRKAA
jgi:phosphatidylethanolamine/phosphatidyl-N-methylethanolamine N-methyltransferase